MSNIVSHGKRMVREDLIKKLLNGDYSVKLKDITNIQSLTDEQINELKAGDVIIKKTGDQTHAYIVSYKEDGQGICLTYADATYLETISYDYTDGHWVYNSKDLNHINLMEDIVDHDGNKRFVEGEIEINKEGFTKLYAKWSLSGTHLMIVVCCKVANTTTIANNDRLCAFTLPKYISDKITPLWATAIENKVLTLYANDWTSQSISAALTKTDVFAIVFTNYVTLSSDKNFRIQYDILINQD